MNTTSLSAQASATVVAGSTGIRHIATGATFSMATAVQLAVTTIGLAIIDGATGGTTYLWRAVANVSSNGMTMIASPALNLYGSAATALTAEFSAGISNASQMVTLTYHDTMG